MAKWNQEANEIFARAVEIEEATLRAEYVDQACANNSALREEVVALLDAHGDAGSFLENPAFASTPTSDFVANDNVLPTSGDGESRLGSNNEDVGTKIGPYTLLQKLGEGGMGVVYMAEQTKPLQRRVALKVIKPGMDSRAVIARFEAERQALAMMDHPNIARVFDAGTTESGRPYFVMELVKGLPITQYCDEQRLTPRERLELFVPICQAADHAHQKGIVHRDLKPTNVLVAQFDKNPVPKIIDFGVAKAISQRLTEETMVTQFGQLVGTVEYMSPEQARFNQLDIDTRSDVYSLGVLLYELLTGQTPFDKRRLRSAALDELLRIIREEEPPLPSSKLSSSEALPSIAANRRVEPRKLGSLMRGDLDWILMKSLEKERSDRYESAHALAEDIDRYLNNRAVVASPRTFNYRLRRFARRYKSALTAAAVVAAVCVVVAMAFAWWRFDPRPPDSGPATPQAAIEGALTVSQDAKNGGRFRTIGEALDAATPGTTIQVLDNATYAESLRLVDRTRHDGIRLVASKNAVIFGADISSVSNFRIEGFRFQSDGTRLHLITISGQASGGILDSLDIQGSRQNGGIAISDVLIEDSEPPLKVQNCQFSIGQGVSISGTPEKPTSRVCVWQNSFKGGAEGVEIRGRVSRVWVAGNIIRDCFNSGIEVQDLAATSRDVLVANNTVFQCLACLQVVDREPFEEFVAGQVEVYGNVLFAANGADVVSLRGTRTSQLSAVDGSPLNESWTFRANWRDHSGNSANEAVPRAKGDHQLNSASSLLRDPGDKDYLRPRENSPLGNGGVGGELPPFAGAVPSRADNKWDWHGTWQRRTASP